MKEMEIRRLWERCNSYGRILQKSCRFPKIGVASLWDFYEKVKIDRFSYFDSFVVNWNTGKRQITTCASIVERIIIEYTIVITRDSSSSAKIDTTNRTLAGIRITTRENVARVRPQLLQIPAASRELLIPRDVQLYRTYSHFGPPTDR